jgi:hypothetical protein
MPFSVLLPVHERSFVENDRLPSLHGALDPSTSSAGQARGFGGILEHFAKRGCKFLCLK